MIGVLMVAIVAFMSVLEHNQGQAEAGYVGLSLSYALSVTSLLQGMDRG